MKASTLNLCEQAEELRISSIMGLIEKSEIIQWADNLIEKSETVPSWVLDVSLSANLSDHQFESNLREIECGKNLTLVAYAAMARLSNAFKSGTISLRDAIKMLEVWIESAQVPEQDLGRALTPTCIADDAMHGIYDNDDIRKSIEDCFAYFAETRKQS